MRCESMLYRSLFNQTERQEVGRKRRGGRKEKRGEREDKREEGKGRERKNACEPPPYPPKKKH